MVFLGVSVLSCKSLPIGRTTYRPLGNVGVIGLGTMGGEIAAYLAKRGSHVYGVDIASKARQRAAKQDLDGIYARIDDLPVSLGTVIEAVPEDIALKGSILEQLSNHVSDDTYLATISSTIPCSTYADRISHPERLMNAHILPDLRTRRFVELQGPGDYTKKESLEAMARAFKQKAFAVAIINGESPGYIFNRIWHDVMFTMFDLMREYSPVTIEYSCRDYFDMPYGGVMAMDLIGYDTLYKVFGRVEKTMGVPVPEVIVEMNRKKIYGLESGRGFFEYDSPDLEGFHKTAREFSELYPGLADEVVGECIWSVIKGGARNLVEHGQDKDDVYTAVRYGFPIERKSLLEELDELIGRRRDSGFQTQQDETHKFEMASAQYV
jgi:3-hydroxyacyl-CoA dehydrogenase